MNNRGINNVTKINQPTDLIRILLIHQYIAQVHITVDYLRSQSTKHWFYLRNKPFKCLCDQLPASGLLPLKVLVAGQPSNQIELVWETWNPSTGWNKAGSSQTETIAIDTLDPEDFDPGLAADIDLPIEDKGQATLYAERAWERPDGSTVTLRSNPLLVTVYEASA